MNKLINVNIKNENGKLLVSSRDIAKGLEKEHKDVLRKIEDVLTVGEFSEREFITTQGNKYKEYLLDKNAFILLVINYTGYNDFKRAYIKRFDEMEKQLNIKMPKSYPEALRLLAEEVERKELMQKQRDEGAWPHRPSREGIKTQSRKIFTRDGKLVRCEGSFGYFSPSKKSNATGRKYDWRNLKNIVKAPELAGTRRLTQITEVSIATRLKPGRMFMVCNFLSKMNYLKTETERYPMVFTLNVMETIQEKFVQFRRGQTLFSAKARRTSRH